MKTRTIAFIIMTGCFASCDMSYPLLVDGHQERRVSCDCGSVVLKGWSAISDCIEVNLEGDFTVNPDSLRFKHPVKITKDAQPYFYQNDRPVDSHQPFQVTGTNKLRISLSVDLPLHWGRTGTIELLPSDFILCDGKPVITDTIRFACKPRKQRKK